MKMLLVNWKVLSVNPRNENTISLFLWKTLKWNFSFILLFFYPGKFNHIKNTGTGHNKYIQQKHFKLFNWYTYESFNSTKSFFLKWSLKLGIYYRIYFAVLSLTVDCDADARSFLCLSCGSTSLWYYTKWQLLIV